MPELFQNNPHSSLIPTKVASEISGYHADYLARLCREKKIIGEQFGRSWLIDKNSLESFVTEQKNRNALRAEKLRNARRKEYQKESQKEYRKTKKPIPAALREKIIPAGTVTRAQEFAWRTLRET